MITKVKPKGGAAKAKALADAAALVEEEHENITHLEVSRQMAGFFRACIISLGAGRKGALEDSEYSPTAPGYKTGDGEHMTGHEALVLDAYNMAQIAFDKWREWVQEVTIVKGTEYEEEKVVKQLNKIVESETNG
jgi:hypothetical protein